ncbi:MAG TPA: serine hydrolase domain-containing protein [Acidimicrobiales bacterium]|nr:serine hydrolase domain-containing protein [Acidimicrobiales bacterium]
MAGIEVTDKPEELGLSGERLARIGPFFASRYVDSGKLPGVLTLVARQGRVAHFECSGWADVEAGAALRPDTIFRIYSMTKPITSVAVMSLYEEGHFQLDDKVSRFLPSFADLQVWADGTPEKYTTTAPEREMTIRDLLTHTSGLTYGFMLTHPVDALYRERGVERPDQTLAEMVDRLAEVPLLFSPGTRWNYSVSTDVVGRLVEVMSGSPLDRFLAERVFDPLGMVDTGFSVPAASAGRLAANYVPGPNQSLALLEAPATSAFLRPPSLLVGGGGLVSTAADYLRFAQMLLNGGELAGTRILGRKTVAYMTSNHLPTGGDLGSMGQPVFSETNYEGIGFGLGVSVVLDPARAQVMGSVGEYAWGGMASTCFWVDPVEELIGMLLTQLVPSSTYPIRREMRVLTNQALID